MPQSAQQKAVNSNLKDISELSDSEILKLRFKDVAVSIKDTELEERINQLYRN